MKKIFLILSLAGAVVILSRCTASKTMIVKPTDTELVVAKKRWPDATLQTLTDGHAIYTTKCNTCHGVFKIAKFSETKWEHEITDMAPKAKLSDAEKETLRRYILSARESAAAANVK